MTAGKGLLVDGQETLKYDPGFLKTLVLIPVRKGSLFKFILSNYS